MSDVMGQELDYNALLARGVHRLGLLASEEAAHNFMLALVRRPGPREDGRKRDERRRAADGCGCSEFQPTRPFVPQVKKPFTAPQLLLPRLKDTLDASVFASSARVDRQRLVQDRVHDHPDEDVWDWERIEKGDFGL